MRGRGHWLLMSAGLASCIGASGEPDQEDRARRSQAKRSAGALLAKPGAALVDERSRVRLPLVPTGRGAVQRGTSSPLHVFHDGFVATSEDGAFGFATESIRSGTLELAIQPTPTLYENAFDIDRGDVVESFSSLAAGLEQTFVFQSRPEGDGDLLVRIATPGLTFSRRDARGLVFEAQGHPGTMTYGHGTWIDARGSKWAVASRVDDRGIELRVSARVLAESLFPAVLDPVIFGPQFVDTLPAAGASLTAYDTFGAAIVYTGAQFFAAWSENSPQKEGIRSKVVTVDGAAIEPTSQVTLHPNERHLYPHLSWSSGRVAMQVRRLPASGSAIPNTDLRFFDPTTGAYQPPPVAMVGNNPQPASTAYSTGFAFVDGSNQIAILAASGAVLKTAALPNCGGGASATEIGSNGTSLLVYRNGCRIHFATDGTYVWPPKAGVLALEHMVWNGTSYVGLATTGSPQAETFDADGATLVGPFTLGATGSVAGISFDGSHSVALVRADTGTSVFRITSAGALTEPSGVQLFTGSSQGAGTNASAIASTPFQRSIAVSQVADPISGKNRILASVIDFRGAPGDACSSPAECVSGFCSDEVCCDTACGGSDDSDCQACSAAKGAAASGTCGPLSTGKTCRAGVDECDVAETCDGQSLACPPDGFADATQSCRAAVDACDKAEFCSGSGPACPSDALKTSTTKCRSAISFCDATEFCDGVQALCPPDLYQPDGTACGGGTCVTGACVPSAGGSGGTGGQAGGAGAAGSPGGGSGAAGTSGLGGAAASGAGGAGVGGSAGKAGGAGAGNGGKAGGSGGTNAGNGGAANAGNSGAANAGNGGTVNAGNGGTVNAGNGGAANAGKGGAANAGKGGAANAGNGGASGSTGKAGGPASTGGSGGNAGSAAAPAGGSGGASGSGAMPKAGASGVTAGAAGSAGAGQGATDVAAEPSAGEEGGCGCQVITATDAPRALSFFAASALLVHARRRRRSARA